MAVVIRMRRTGAKKRPFYRVVVADSRYPRDGRYIEQLGYYDPLTAPATFRVDAGKFEAWVRRGARPSESVSVMMAKHAPQALRPAPLPKPAVPEAATEEAVEGAVEVPKKAPKPRAAKPRAAAKKKAPAPRKGAVKKAKARAKAKTKKAAGTTKPKTAKKTKK